MIGSFQIRTDLALEAREGYDGDESRIRGVTVQEESDPEREIYTTVVRIETENGARAIGKPVGTYITLEAPNMSAPDEGYHREISRELSRHLRELMGERGRSVLVVGLGNREVTPDALGPNVVGNLRITRHMIREYGKSFFKRSGDGMCQRHRSRSHGADRNGDPGDREGRGRGDEAGSGDCDRRPGSQKYKASEPDDSDYRHRDPSGIRSRKSPEWD